MRKSDLTRYLNKSGLSRYLGFCRDLGKVEAFLENGGVELLNDKDKIRLERLRDLIDGEVLAEAN